MPTSAALALGHPSHKRLEPLILRECSGSVITSLPGMLDQATGIFEQKVREISSLPGGNHDLSSFEIGVDIDVSLLF